MTYSVLIAGSTSHTVQCAQALQSDSRFKITAILTPEPKPLGRKQVLTPNPLHQFADQHGIPTILIADKISADIKEQLLAADKPDFLLVVDFGYLVPTWLLQHPKIAPLNIHPSILPRWRGATPGQHVMLYGESETAVSVIVMGEGLDTGPLVHQEYFDVDPTWTQTEYYQYSFDLAGKFLGNKMVALADGTVSPVEQPEHSPTPFARRFSKEDGFVEWEVVRAAMSNAHQDVQLTSKLLQEVEQKLKNLPQTLANASRALNPWPTLWTIVPTAKGDKRMQILATEIDNNTLVLKQVKLEGQSTAEWNQVKNQLI